jgi:hypothetical protein
MLQISEPLNQYVGCEILLNRNKKHFLNSGGSYNKPFSDPEYLKRIGILGSKATISSITKNSNKDGGYYIVIDCNSDSWWVSTKCINRIVSYPATTHWLNKLMTKGRIVRFTATNNRYVVHTFTGLNDYKGMSGWRIDGGQTRKTLSLLDTNCNFRIEGVWKNHKIYNSAVTRRPEDRSWEKRKNIEYFLNEFNNPAYEYPGRKSMCGVKFSKLNARTRRKAKEMKLL